MEPLFLISRFLYEISNIFQVRLGSLQANVG
jgi:hypothetical protein